MSEAFDPRTVAQLDATWGDPFTWREHGQQWVDLAAVRARIAASVSGAKALPPLAWMFEQVAAERALPLGKVLVLACGQGHAEREVLHRGWARQAVALDLSGQVLAHARAVAEEQGLAIQYLQADMNRLPLGQAPFEPGSFDAVLSLSAVHHCSELERLYADVAELLVPGGWFLLDEYIGPDRFQWSDAHVRQLNALSDLLPPRLRRTADGRLKGNMRRPEPQEVIAVDASEAVRSSQVLPLLPAHFELQAVRPYGGTLLHTLLSCIAQNFQDEAGAPYLDALMAAEEELLATGGINHHFACVIARRPRAASAASPRAR